MTTNVGASDALTFTVTPAADHGRAGRGLVRPRGLGGGRYVVPTGGRPKIKSDT